MQLAAFEFGYNRADIPPCTKTSIGSLKTANKDLVLLLIQKTDTNKLKEFDPVV